MVYKRLEKTFGIHMCHIRATPGLKTLSYKSKKQLILYQQLEKDQNRNNDITPHPDVILNMIIYKYNY